MKLSETNLTLKNAEKPYAKSFLLNKERKYRVHTCDPICIFTHLVIQGCKENDCEVLAMPMCSYAFDIVKFCAIAQSEVKFAIKHLQSNFTCPSGQT